MHQVLPYVYALAASNGFWLAAILVLGVVGTAAGSPLPMLESFALAALALNAPLISHTLALTSGMQSAAAAILLYWAGCCCVQVVRFAVSGNYWVDWYGPSFVDVPLHFASRVAKAVQPARAA